MLAACLQRRSAAHLDLDRRLHAGQGRIEPDLDLLLGKAAKLGIVVAGRLELGERQRAVVQDHRRGVMTGDERIELAFVSRQLAVHVESGLPQRHAQCLDLDGIDRVLFEKIEQRRRHALHQRGGGPQPQRDLLELPAPAEIVGRELRLPAVGVAVVEAAVLGGEELARRQELLLREQRRQQAGERAAALMKFYRRGSPRRERAGGLAAGEAERLRHGLGVEAAQPSDRRRRAEWAEHAGSVEAAGAERRIIEPDTDAGRDLGSGGNRHEQVAPRACVALGDRQGGRDHLRE